MFGPNFNFLTDTVFNGNRNVMPYTPVSNNFDLLDGTKFLLLDGSDFLLLIS